MKLSPKAQEIFDKVNKGTTKLGDLRNIAAAIRKDHQLATELWATGNFFPRLQSILIMDKKALAADVVDRLFKDMAGHNPDESIQLADWLMANQLAKDKKTIALMESWEHSALPLQRRIYWYYQGRLRWVGQTPPENTKALLSAIKKKLPSEPPEVQWAMNFTAGWIGVFDAGFRDQCIAIGVNTGLYKDEVVHKGCTPNYLPEFIAIEARKRNL